MPSDPLPFPPAEPTDLTEADINEAIAACDGDPRACIHALLVACAMFEAEAEELRRELSAGFIRARPSRHRKEG